MHTPLLQIQISYLKAKIEAAKSELILQGKIKPVAQTDQVPVIEEERSGEFTASDRDSIVIHHEQLADDNIIHNAPVSTHRKSSSIDSDVLGLSRGSMLSMLRSSSSFVNNSSQGSLGGTHESLSASARFSLFDEVGMPSRSKARELEKQKQADEEEKADAANDTCDNVSDAYAKKECDQSESLLQRVQKLIAQRESEINVLEKQTEELDKETTLYHHKISDMYKDHEATMEAAKRERDSLLQNIQRMEADNEKLDAMLLETGVLLQEKEMSCRLLEMELRDARNDLYRIHSVKKCNKRRSEPKSRKQSLNNVTRSDSMTHQIPLNDVDGGEKRGVSRLTRRGSSNSVVSSSSSMSALTLDFDDIVDILDSSRHSMEDFDTLLDSLTSNSPVVD